MATLTKKQKTLKLLTTLVNLVLEIGGEPVCEGGRHLKRRTPDY